MIFVGNLSQQKAFCEMRVPLQDNIIERIQNELSDNDHKVNNQPSEPAENLYEGDPEEIIVCPYCKGKGESYLGMITPIYERNLLNPKIYLCEVCEGEKKIKRGVAKAKIELLIEIRGF